jgi:16S rRNA (guanine(966)-N(2))-methyltransferase RsmD
MTGLRVIAGKARGRKLRSVPGETTRPITDRTKESLFNILGADIVGSSMLDLFAGTGAVGIEALSRGAAFVQFVDIHPAALQTIRMNLDSTGLLQDSDVLKSDAFRLLDGQPERVFQYVYIAPPQYKQMWKRAVQMLDENPGWLADDGWVIVQIHPVEYEPLELMNLVEFDQRRYGSTMLVFFERLSLEMNQ